MIKYFCYELQNHITLTGCGSAWLERLIWDQEVAGSNPVTPIVSGCSSMVELQPSKLITWVRFPSPALLLRRMLCILLFLCLSIKIIKVQDPSKR